jgi:hypothetical protein
LRRAEDLKAAEPFRGRLAIGRARHGVEKDIRRGLPRNEVGGMPEGGGVQRAVEQVGEDDRRLFLGQREVAVRGDLPGLWRDNQDANRASIWMRRGGRVD